MQRCKIRDIVNIKKGDYITKKDAKEGDYPVIIGGKEPAYYIDRFNHEGKAIVISRSGASAGYVSFWNEPIFITDGFLIEPKEPYSYEYVYYALKSRQLQLHNMQNGSAIPHVTPSLINRVDIDLHDEKDRDIVVDILLKYDQAIENNEKRINILDQMAGALFKEWFIRFRFPGHEAAKFTKGKMGRIPTSFCELKMADVIEYYIGGGWGNEEPDKQFSQEAYVIRGADFPSISKGNVGSCPLRYHKESNYKKRVLKENDIILEVSGGTAEQPVGRTILVEKDVIKRLGEHVICASFCKLVRLKDFVNPYYFYYWMQFLYDTRIIDRFQLQSTGIINFQFEYFLRKGDIPIPPIELMNKFEKLVKPLHDEKQLLARKNENLIKQRELLLPRLMSGKITV